MCEIKLSSENRYVLDTFNSNFHKYKNKSIALYGVGVNTKVLLENIEGYNIIGLMDAECEGKYIFGKKVLSYDEVINNVELIVIVARKSVINIIYKRIEFLEKKHNITIYNIEGEAIGKKSEDLLLSDDIEYWNVREEQLIEFIDTHEVISFDIFDTLIMRKILRPQNIFEVVERVLLEEYNFCLNFRQARIDSEFELNKVYESPNIHEIYDKLQEKLHIDNELKERIKIIEIETELNYITPRSKMVEIFEYALKNNKEVYLLSDMYLPKELMKKLLSKCGIKGYKDLIVSCDVKRTKASGRLYAYYKTLIKNKGKPLHIGDNVHADIEIAKRYSVDTFQVLSSYEMVLKSGFKELLVDVKIIENNTILGMFVARAFNNPFILNRTKGKLIVDDLFDMSYLFIGPLILNFMIWLIQELKAGQYEKILFSARDGYLIDQIYSMLIKKLELKNMPEGIYFKTSRRAITVATISCEQDILLILQKPFKGTKGELLKYRFGINADKNDIRANDILTPTTNGKEVEEYVMAYKQEIIRNAEDERDSYMKYINELGLIECDKIAFFDLVAAGTVQYYLSKLLNKKIIGFYFATLNLPNYFYKDNKNINTLFGNSNYYNMKTNVAKYHIFLESILTAPTPTLIRCNTNGSFKYDENEVINFHYIDKCQKGIICFIEDFIDVTKNIITTNNINYRLIDTVFGELNSINCIIDEKFNELFYINGSYCGEHKIKAW